MGDLPDDWRAANRARWNERVGIHLDAAAYDLTPLREGRAVLHPIEESEIGDVAGPKIAHLQCHFGRDSLTLAQKEAEVVGLDFSREAIATARRRAGELGLAGRAATSGPTSTTRRRRSPGKRRSTGCTSPGTRSAGCRTWTAGRGS